jgi:hypothetical protein
VLDFNLPSSVVAFIPHVPEKKKSMYANELQCSRLCLLLLVSTSGRLHSEFVRILFLQTHWETDRFFPDSGVQLVEHDRGLFHFPREVFSVQIKIRVGLPLDKSSTLRIMNNKDGVSITSKSHTHPSFSSINLVFLVSSLSSHRHSEIGFIFRSRFIVS